MCRGNAQFLQLPKHQPVNLALRRPGGPDLKRVRPELAPALLVSVLKLVLYPAASCAALYALGLRGMSLEIPLLLLASPTAVVSHIMAREMKGDEQLSGAIVIGSTLLSLFSISAWLAFFQWIN